MRVLHLHSSFHAGGKELRCAKLINAFGKGIEHDIVSAIPDALDAHEAISPHMKVRYPRDFPSLQGKPLPRRLERIARALLGYDLVLTYNWGAMDAVMAHTLLGPRMGLPPLVHHEDGFNHDEAVKLKTTRNWYRRVALVHAEALVVPSRRLEEIALNTWAQPRAKVHRIANGIQTAAYGRKPRRDALPRVIKHEDDLWIGTVAGLRPVKDLPLLVRAFSTLPDNWQLVILGEGPEREAIIQQAIALDVGHRVHLPGFIADPAKVIGLFDIFALSSQSEQFPISVVEAMAAGLPVASPGVGDVAAMVAAENRPFIVSPGSEAELALALEKLAADPVLRRHVGAANQVRARAEYDEGTMVAAYRQVYARAMKRERFG
ncbi:glycosyltransferase [Novosphingobium sp. TH158]|uniref:glycosyltransferase n=1 Tax=Novosphingobium sp. TH158 TaxID=2067455 RepID=UPI000C7BD0F0|nr:glycosyltransferase [Novosphingobium sp. TH158]PLK26559.1 glycosyl transferase family 1 [Novosphingobium sp. TH158]